jgi:hypothetical protein
MALIVLPEALAQHARAAQRVRGVGILRVPLGELFVEHRRLVVVGDVLLDARRREQRVGRLARGRILVRQLLVGGDRLVLLLGLLQHRRRVVERLGARPSAGIFARHAQVERRRLVVLAFAGVLLARLHHRVDDQRVQPLLLVARRERLGLLERRAQVSMFS